MRVRFIRADKGRENIRTEVKEFRISNRVSIQPSSAYDTERNGIAECLVRKHLARARVIITANNIPPTLWNE